MRLFHSIRQYFEHRAIRRFLAVLGPLLNRRYGGAGPYTPAQVRTTVDAHNLKQTYIDYGYFVFCIPDEYAKLGVHIQEVDRFREYRDSGNRASGGRGGAEGGCGD